MRRKRGWVFDRLRVSNFKSIREQELALRPLNVFIGGNGSGKSNLIGVFHLLKEIVGQNLAGYTQLKGGADSMLRAVDREDNQSVFRQLSSANRAGWL